MKVAVTGATGFIGRHVVAALCARSGVELVSTGRRQERPDWLHSDARYVRVDMEQAAADEYLRLSQPEVLVHLAWEGLPNYRSLLHVEQELPRQYAFLSRLIRAGLPALFVAGTCYEYGMQYGELAEACLAEPSNPYALAKTSLRQQLQFLAAQTGCRLTWGRLFYTYGPGQAVTSLYSQLMAAVAAGDRSFRMSRGDQLRDFLPVAQFAEIITDLALGHPGAGVVNVCSGQPVSVRAFVESLLREYDASMDLELGFYPVPDYEPFAFWGSTRKLNSLLGDRAPSV